MELMSVNAKGSTVRGKDIVICGTCVFKEKPKYLEEFRKNENHAILHFCPEKEHINMAFYKIMSIMSVAKSLTIVTTDGSPHCVQLHYIADEVNRYSERKFAVKHFVINNAKMHEVFAEDVKLSRYLSKIKRLREMCEISP